jgi:hypothetical protein
MRLRPGEVLHFSEDPHIAAFTPHVAPTATDQTPAVWAVDEANAPSYWFPRQCPRAMAWRRPTTTADDHQRILGQHADRVHMIEYGWLDRMLAARVFAYRFDAADFEPYGDTVEPHAFVGRRIVKPIAPAEPVGNLLELHESAGIELRLGTSLWPWWYQVTHSSVGFSGIRLRNATPPLTDPGSTHAGESTSR